MLFRIFVEELIEISNMIDEKNEIVPIKIYDFPIQSEKIGILVKALRLVATDEDIKNRKLCIPDEC